jgi:hypothetical protein
MPGTKAPVAVGRGGYLRNRASRHDARHTCSDHYPELRQLPDLARVIGLRNRDRRMYPAGYVQALQHLQ